MTAAAGSPCGADLTQLAIDSPNRAGWNCRDHFIERLQHAQPFRLAQPTDPGRVIPNRLAHDLTLGLRKTRGGPAVVMDVT